MAKKTSTKKSKSTNTRKRPSSTAKKAPRVKAKQLMQFKEKKFKTVEEFEKFISLFILGAVDQSAERMKDIMKDYVESDWYNKYTPKEYERMKEDGGVLGSVINYGATKFGNGAMSMIGYDTSRVIPEKRKGTFNAHMDSKGRETNHLVPGFIEYGAFFCGRGRTKGIHALENTLSYAGQYYEEWIEDYMTKYGVEFKK